MRDEKAWEWLNENELSYSIWEKKYRYSNETLDEWLDRVSAGNKEIRNLIYNKKFAFGGRILANRGIENSNVSLSNCYVITPPEDTLEDITRVCKDLAITYSRGGGCIEENTKIIVKDKGRIPIKDVKIGDFVLSFNIDTHKDEWKEVLDWHYTNVKLEDQIEYVYSNGVRLKTSKKHPILNLSSDGYAFKKYNELKAESHINKSLNQKKLVYTSNQKIDDISWFIGCHMGDGTADFHKVPRIRINGDNYNVINKFAEILSELNDSKIQPHRENSDYYKSIVWTTTSGHHNNSVIFNKYFDNQINRKTYTWKVPEYIKDNDSYIPFLAGLVDSDGYITDEGNIDIAIYSKDAIEEIASYLSEHGQIYHVKTKYPKRVNESPLYRLYIYTSSSIYKLIYDYIQHDQKKAAMSQHLQDKTNKINDLVPITKNELETINKFNYKDVYSKSKRIYYTLKTHQYNINNNKKIGSKALYYLYSKGVFTTEQYDEILSRTSCKQIILDNSVKHNYIDITVDGNENYYAGDFGFVNIHNCGVDISKLRPAGAKVNNAAKESTGPVSFMQIYSNITGTIAQEGRRGALMISLDINHPDIEAFIDCKTDLNAVTYANISVRVNDTFMEAVEQGKDYLLRWPCDAKISDEGFDYKNYPYGKLQKLEKSNVYVKKVKAKELFNKLCKNNWDYAEPGILFWGNVETYNLIGNNPEFKYAGVNPCEPFLCMA